MRWLMAIGGEIATTVSAVATAVYALVSALSLLLLWLQLRDARRYGAAPALHALLKEMEEHMLAVRKLGADADDDAVLEAIERYLEFFERVEHLRGAGVLPVDVLRRAIGPVLRANLSDPRFAKVIANDPRRHAEVLTLAERLNGRR